MAFTITSLQTAASIVSGATLVVPGVPASVADWLVLGIAADNAGAAGISSITGVSDSAGNTWTKRLSTNRTPGAVANDGTTLEVWTCAVTNAIVSGSVTIAFSPNTTSKVASLKRVQPGAGEVVAFFSAGAGVTGAGTAFSSGNVAVALGHTIFGFTAIQAIATVTADADTTDGVWSAAHTLNADTGTQATSQRISTQQKTVTAAGNQSYDTSTAASRDYALNWLILFNETAVGTATGTGSASGVGASDALAVGTATGTGTAIAAGEAESGAVGIAKGTATAIARGSIWPRIYSLRILVQFDWTTETTSRLWDGGGPFVDSSGNVWLGAGAFGDLDEIEQAINGEAAEIGLTLSGVGGAEADLVWLSYTTGQIIGSTVTILIQSCGTDDQPIGVPEIRFSGTIDDISFKDAVADRRRVSTISVPVVNKFTVRRLSSGSVLSDADQRARSAILNPDGEPDLFCERVPGLLDKTLTWPQWF